MAKAKLKVAQKAESLRLDLGCGPNKREGFTGVDILSFDGKVNVVLNLVEKHPGDVAVCAGIKNCVRKCESPEKCEAKAVHPYKPWPWKSDSCDEVHSSHFIEHLNGPERVVFFNELHRILRKNAKATIIVPHWSSGRAYGDLTHQWPPVVEFFWYYLDKVWREANAPHVGLNCDFLATWGYSVAPAWQARNQETQMFGLNHYREVAQDMICTLIARK